MRKAELLFRDAFERLKSNKVLNVPKGTKVSQNNVAKEAGKHPTALKKDRFPLLVLEIQDYVKLHEIDFNIIKKSSQIRNQRTVSQRLADCRMQRDKLASICEAQNQMIEDLQSEINDLKKGFVAVSPIK